MNETQAAPTTDNPSKDRQKTQFANLVRYVPSGTYYARLRVAGKLIRKSLKTDVLPVTKLRLGDLDKRERQRAESTDAAARGKMTVGDAVEIHKQRVAGDASLKPRTKEYDGQRLVAPFTLLRRLNAFSRRQPQLGLDSMKHTWGKLQDKVIHLGIRELLPFGGRLRARGKIVGLVGKQER